MALATPTFESIDLNDLAVWTKSGNIVAIDDLQGTLTAARLDGTLDAAETTQKISNTTTKLSGAFYVRYNGTPSSNEGAIGQIDNNGFKFLFNASGNVQISATKTTGNLIVSRFAGSIISDNNWHLIQWDIEALGSGEADVNIFVDGTEVTYIINDFKVGTGWDQFTNTANFYYGDASGQAEDEFTGDLARIYLWDGTSLSIADHVEHRANEIACIGGCPSTGGDADYASTSLLFS